MKHFILITLLCFCSCLKTEVIQAPTHKEIVLDTITKVKRPILPKDTTEHSERDSTHTEDTIRIPIGWNPSVEDWDEI